MKKSSAYELLKQSSARDLLKLGVAALLTIVVIAIILHDLFTYPVVEYRRPLPPAPAVEQGAAPQEPAEATTSGAVRDENEK